MYGCQIHIGGVKSWVGQWSTMEQASRAYDYFCMHEYGECALSKLNFPEERHHMDDLVPLGIRQITKAMERENRMAEVEIAEVQIAERNIHPYDDPLVRQLLQQEPDLMAYQHQVFGTQDPSSVGPMHVATPSHSVGPLHVATSSEDAEDDDRFWRNFDVEFDVAWARCNARNR